MNPSAAVPPSIFDMQSLSALKKGAKDSDPQALKAAARQFEALFLQMMLKSMRDATPREGMFDSEQTRLYESLLDQQLAQVMATRGGTGLAAMIERQLARGNESPNDPLGSLPLLPAVKGLPLNREAPPGLPLEPVAPPAFKLDGTINAPAAPSVPAVSNPGAAETVSPAMRDFVARVWPHAVEAGRTTGIPAHFLVAQAALETGWGRSEPRHADGRPSFNLFGIKAGRGWQGAVAENATTEYADGAPQRQVEGFRSYGSYAESFRDYARLLQSNPRYAALLGSHDASTFAHGLQRAGYATDPLYGAKLERIITGMAQRPALFG
jgi:flagellar protein FlgJ